MTLCNLAVGKRASYLISDCAAYNHRDGRILGMHSKVSASPRLRVAMAVSGHTPNWPDDNSEWMDQFDTQEALLAALPGKIASDVAEVRKFIESDQTGEARDIPNFNQVFVALWSKRRNQPEAYISGAPGHMFGAGYRPGTIAGVGFVSMPTLGPGFDPMGDDLTREQAIAMAEAQRRIIDDNGICRVGCAVEMTTVSAGGIETQEILRWPEDRVGEKVDPFAAAAEAASAKPSLLKRALGRLRPTSIHTEER